MHSFDNQFEEPSNIMNIYTEFNIQNDVSIDKNTEHSLYSDNKTEEKHTIQSMSDSNNSEKCISVLVQLVFEIFKNSLKNEE